MFLMSCYTFILFGNKIWNFIKYDLEQYLRLPIGHAAFSNCYVFYSYHCIFFFFANYLLFNKSKLFYFPIDLFQLFLFILNLLMTICSFILLSVKINNWTIYFLKLRNLQIIILCVSWFIYALISLKKQGNIYVFSW